MRRATRDINEAHLRERFEQGSISAQMRRETVEAADSRINEGESNHRGRGGSRRKKHRELVYEIALGLLVANGSGVAFRGEKLIGDAELLAEVVQFVGFGFKVCVLQMRQDEVQSRSEEHTSELQSPY